MQFTNQGGSEEARKIVLNAGSGPRGSQTFHRGFVPEEWDVVRLDINPELEPDVVGSVTDMRDIFPDGCFDAVWSSHNMEHLWAHEVQAALLEFKRILKGTGFLLITCPDLEAVARLVLDQGLHAPAYHSPAGPIAPHDMIFGHQASIARGDVFMAHRTGFTQESLGEAAVAAGFDQAKVGCGEHFALWALLLMPAADENGVRRCLEGTEAAFLLEP